MLNAYGPMVENATAVSDAMFVAMRAGKTTIAELSSSLGQVAPLAAQTGVGFNELLASISALTKGGISTTQAMTGMRAVLAAVAKPSSEAAKLAEELGIQFNTAALESQGLAGFLETLVDATGGSTDELAQLFGGVEALVPIMALAGGAGEDFAAILQDMAEKGGATEEAFNKIVNSPGFQMDRVLAAMKVESIQLGTAIATELVPIMKFLADNMDQVFAVAKTLAVFLTAQLAVAMGRTIVGAATTMGLRMIYVGSAMGATTTASALLTGALGYATTAFRALTLAMASNPFGLLAVAIAGVVSYFAFFRDTTDSLSLATDNVTLAINDEIAAVQQLGQLLDGANIMSVQAAETKLAEAEARRANILALIEERNQLNQSAAAAITNSEQLERLYEARDSLAAPGTDLEQMNARVRESYEAIDQEIAEILRSASELTASSNEHSDALAESEANIERIRTALANAKDGQVGFNGAIVQGVDLGDRLNSSMVNSSNSAWDAVNAGNALAGSLYNAANAAAIIATNLGQAPAAIGRLQQQANSVIERTAMLNRDTYQEFLEEHYGLTTAAGAAEEAYISGVIGRQLREYDRLTAANEAYRTALEAARPTSGSTGGSSGGATAGNAELSAETEAANEQLERQVQLLEQISDPMKKYELDLAALNDLLEEGRISGEEYARTLRDIRIAFLDTQTDLNSGLERGLLKLQRDYEDVASSVEDALTNAFRGAEDALVEFVTTGKLDFRELASSIIADLARIAIQQAIMKPLTNFLGGLIPGLGLATGGGFNVGATGAPTTGLATGGDFMVGGGGGVDSQLVSFRASPGERVSVTRPGETDNGSRGPGVVFNITTPDADSFRRSETQIAARMNRLVARGQRNS